MVRVLHLTRFCMGCIVERWVSIFFVFITFYDDLILTGVFSRLIGLSWTIEEIMIFFVFYNMAIIYSGLCQRAKKEKKKTTIYTNMKSIRPYFRVLYSKRRSRQTRNKAQHSNGSQS